MPKKQPVSMGIMMYGAAPFGGPIDPYEPSEVPETDPGDAMKRALDIISSRRQANPNFVEAVRDAREKLMALRLSQKMTNKEARANLDEVIGILTVALSMTQSP